MQVNDVRRGASGLRALREMMDRLRGSPPLRVEDDEVIAIDDYQTGKHFDTRTLTEAALALPTSNVLVLHLASGSRVVARPSGTEPKAKFYFDVREDVRHDEPVPSALDRANRRMKTLASAFMAYARPSV